MQSPNRSYLRELDELRGFAALLVLFYHCVHRGFATIGQQGWPISHNPLLTFFYEGHTGVGLFMVLSGFVLARGTFGAEIRYGQFLKNRALRILPLMTVVCVFAIYGSRDLNLEGVLAPFMFMANTPFRFTDVTNLTGTVWTISVEFQFYLIAPFLIAFVGGRGLFKFALPAIALVVLLRILTMAPISDQKELYRLSYFTIVGRLNQFIIGIALAYCVERYGWTERNRVTICALLLSVLGVLAFAYVMNRQGGVGAWRSWHVLRPEIEGVLWAGVIASYAAVQPFKASVFGRLLAWAGLISFSMYILHWPIELALWKAYADTGFTAIDRFVEIFLFTAFAILPVVAGVSALSYYCVEAPFLSLRKKYVDTKAFSKNASGEKPSKAAA